MKFVTTKASHISRHFSNTFLGTSHQWITANQGKSLLGSESCWIHFHFPVSGARVCWVNELQKVLPDNHKDVRSGTEVNNGYQGD